MCMDESDGCESPFHFTSGYTNLDSAFVMESRDLASDPPWTVESDCGIFWSYKF
jgi:hypothetical protein